jgi:hypothetical protein
MIVAAVEEEIVLVKGKVADDEVEVAVVAVVAAGLDVLLLM